MIVKPPIIQGVDAKKYYESLFGDITKLKGSDKDYYALIKQIPHDQLPHMYMCIELMIFYLKQIENIVIIYFKKMLI